MTIFSGAPSNEVHDASEGWVIASSCRTPENHQALLNRAVVT
jgi:hypothetical protein